MGIRDEFDRLMRRAGVTPFRRVGKVRVSYDPRTPGDTIRAALDAVRKFAPSLAEGWPEMTGSVAGEWKAQGLTTVDVCDEPCPRGMDVAACPVEILIDRCERYHFRLSVTDSGTLTFTPVGGWSMSAITPMLPAWFVDACRSRRQEIVASLTAVAGSVS